MLMGFPIECNSSEDKPSFTIMVKGCLNCEVNISFTDKEELVVGKRGVTITKRLSPERKQHNC